MNNYTLYINSKPVITNIKSLTKAFNYYFTAKNIAYNKSCLPYIHLINGETGEFILDNYDD